MTSHLNVLLAALLIIAVPTNCISQRNGVLVAEYDEIALLNEYFEHMHYSNMPFIIINSEMKGWTIYEHLIAGKIFHPERLSTVHTQQANCSCFGSDIGEQNKCEELASTFLYTTNQFEYEYWHKYESDVNSNITDQYRSCIVSQDKTININDFLRKQDEGYQKYKADVFVNANYTKYYTYFGLLSSDLDAMNFIDHISLSPYFQLFNLSHGYNDIESMHFFFANSYYRTIRHYDKSPNLFFMLNGSRIFRLSVPTYSLFNVHPYYHKSGRQEYPSYPFLEFNNNDIDADNINNYEIFEIELYENEILYLPAYWYHEVINSNISCAMNIWWPSRDRLIEDSLNYVGLPINLTKYDLNETKYLSLEDIDEFLYFIQNLIDDFCEIINTHKDRNKYPMKCTNKYYNGHSYLLKSFAKIYPILNNINYNNFEWISMQIQMENIFKCSQGKKVNSSNYLDINLLINNFKYDSYFCYDINDHIKPIWNKAIKRILNDYIMKMTNIAISEVSLMTYFEFILLKLTQNTNLIPFWLALQLI
eukprot:86982_1